MKRLSNTTFGSKSKRRTVANGRFLYLLLALSCGILPNPSWSEAVNIERGRLLYENHCLSCHESRIHIRNNRSAHSIQGVYRQVVRWSRELELSWRNSEVVDVSQYLYRTFYTGNRKDGGDTMNLNLTSSAFSSNSPIPSRYTCDGADISPALNWSGIPAGAKSLALIVDDPDAPDPAAPKMTWVHWVLYNLPADTEGLSEEVKSLPEGTLEGVNDWKRTGYGGPCPPIGRHRYFFKLYALDCRLPDLKRPTKAQLEQAIQGHILDQVELMGTYQR